MPDRDGPCYRCAVRAVQSALIRSENALLFKGDRIGFSRGFLTSALAAMDRLGVDRTVLVELDNVETHADGHKVIGVKKNYCPICRGDLDESPHEVTHCPALTVPDV